LLIWLLGADSGLGNALMLHQYLSLADVLRLQQREQLHQRFHRRGLIGGNK